MRQTIYIDVLLSVELLTGYFMLRAAALLAGRTCSRVRLCAAAVIGAACSLTILLPPLPRPLTLLFAAAEACVMTLAGFGFGSAKAFARTAGCLLLVTLCWGGAMSCLWLFCAPRGLIVNNGAVYFDISPAALTVSVMIFYALSTVISKHLRRRNQARSSCRLSVSAGGRTAGMDAILDTGSLLCEPFSGLPVIIVERAFVSELLPEGFDDFRGGRSYRGDGGLRIVPYSVIGGEGLMAAFLPERITVESADGSRREARAYIGVSEETLGSGYHAVINPDALC